MNHPLHLAVGEEIHRQFHRRFKILRDPACGGTQQLPLFVGERKGRDTRMCCVDLLILESEMVRVIVEIEESGFLPTKIFGKFLQAALATHFIHESQADTPIPYANKVLFVQILDGSKLKEKTKKDSQAKLIEQQIQNILPLGRITRYQLVFVDKNELEDLANVCDNIDTFCQTTA